MQRMPWNVLAADFVCNGIVVAIAVVENGGRMHLTRVALATVGLQALGMLRGVPESEDDERHASELI